MSSIYPDGFLVRGEGTEIYILINGERRLVRDFNQEVSSMGQSFTVPQIPDQELQQIPEGSVLAAAIEASQEDEVVSDMPRRYMSTNAWLSRESGRIDADTRIWTRQPWVGYTGGVMVLFGDANGEYLGRTDLHQFGVDGFRIPFKQWQRLDHWDEAVSRDISRRITRLAIKHTHAPRNRLIAIINEVTQTVKALDQLIDALKAL